MKYFLSVIGGALIATSLVSAQVSASGTISGSFNGTAYDYTIQLLNTGLNTIDAFWFAWLPDYNLMPVAATNILSPTGWAGTSTTDPITSAYGIEWLTSTAPLGVGSTDTFHFTSSVNPTQMQGTDPFFGLPLTYSYVYQGAPYPGTSPFGIINHLVPVPEPATLAVLGIGALLVRRRRSRR